MSICSPHTGSDLFCFLLVKYPVWSSCFLDETTNNFIETFHKIFYCNYITRTTSDNATVTCWLLNAKKVFSFYSYSNASFGLTKQAFGSPLVLYIHTHNNNNITRYVCTVAYWSRLASNVLCKKGVCLYCRLIVNSQARVIDTKFFMKMSKGVQKASFWAEGLLPVNVGQ